MLVLDADPVSAQRSAATIERVGRFDVIATLASAVQARDLLSRAPCQLLIVDPQLAGGGGLELVRWMRGRQLETEVIVHTALRRTDVVREAFRAGALDYVVKPAGGDRLRRGLAAFLVRAAALAGDELDQAAIDRACIGTATGHRWLPKGLSHAGVETVRRELVRFPNATAAELARPTGMSRVTVRRYLEYLVASDQARVTTRPGARGRPAKHYDPG